MEKKLAYWVVAVLVLILLFFIGIVTFTSQPAQAPEVKTNPEFKGPLPGSAPYVKGPTEPPPGY
jgi:hypothetical protein